MAVTSVHVGMRISVPSTSGLNAWLGTILFVGVVPPTAGTWYGVEWDDPGRGRHDGVHRNTGVRFYTTRVPGAGSFIRPDTPGLSFGVPFRNALLSKYAPEGGDGTEGEAEGASKFFATDSNFEVEVVSLSKIREKFRHVERLKEVGLEWEGVNGAGETGEGEGMPMLEVLNLSFNLIPSFEATEEIVQDFGSLKVLALNSNRFLPLSEPMFNLEGFSRLRTLQLNNTLVTWDDMLLLSPSLPALDHLQLGANRLETLGSSHISSEPFPSLTTLNLASNLLSDWTQIIAALAPLNRLDRLILSENRFSSLSTGGPASGRRHLTQLRHLYLTSNLLDSWSSVSEIASQFPLLESLRMAGNPFEKDMPESAARLSAIARIGSLTELESSKITPAEREDAELFYLSLIAKEEGDEASRGGRHPRWGELSLKYDQSTQHAIKKPPTIKSNLIRCGLRISILPSPPPPTTHEIAVLPHQSTRLLRTHFTRKFKQPFSKKEWRMTAILRPGEEGGESLRVEIDPDEEGKEVVQWGLAEGDEVVLERNG